MERPLLPAGDAGHVRLTAIRFVVLILAYQQSHCGWHSVRRCVGVGSGNLCTYEFRQNTHDYTCEDQKCSSSAGAPGGLGFSGEYMASHNVIAGPRVCVMIKATYLTE